MIIIAITFLGIVSLIVFHEWGHLKAAKLFNLKVYEFGIGFPPRIFARRKGETEYSFNWLPFGGFVRIAGEGEDPEYLKNLPEEEKKRLFPFQSAWKRIFVISAGILMNFLAGWLILWAVFVIGTPQGILIDSIQTGSAADISGLKSGETIVGYGKPIVDISGSGENSDILIKNFLDYIRSNQGKNIILQVSNEGVERTVSVSLPTAAPIGQGILGIGFSTFGIHPHGLIESSWLSLKQAFWVIWMTAVSLFGLISGLFTTGRISEGVVGPVGIFSFAYEAGQNNIVNLLSLLSLISLNLAVLNLIPFPALDGGHILMIIIEKIKGSSIRNRTKAVVNMIGISLLLLLVLIITFKDIRNIFSF